MKPIEIFKHKWLLNDLADLNCDIQENYHLKNGETADIGVILNNKCIAFGKYIAKLEVSDKPDSREYFHKYGIDFHQTETEFAFYFDDNVLIVNDLRYNYPFDELLNDYNELFERIKKRTNQ